MEQRPDPTPEGRLIAAAAKRGNFSIRKAAERAGLSYGRWRQITSGVQNVSPGQYAAVRNVPANTIARMATAVGLAPERVETEGRRPDAAQIMRSGDVHLPALAAVPPEPVMPPDENLPPILRGIDPHEAEPFLKAVEKDLTDAAAGIRDPWKDAATDPMQQFELSVLRSDAHDADGKKLLLVISRMRQAGIVPGQSRTRNTGLTASRPVRLGNKVMSMG
jgi:hypothetical protein